MTEPGLATLSALSAALSAGELTSQQIVANCLERIRRLDPALGAFATVYPERAMAQARALDDLRAAGTVLGPLHGLPIAVKDLIEWPGEICTIGSAAWRDRVSQTEATVLRRLLSAGMIPVGRTNMVEMAFGGWGTNPLCGTPRNPWDMDTHRVPGGSSSGSGVAVAAGMVPAALGSDTGGSVRIPAAMNGIVGFKPTYGQVSLAGCFPLSYNLDSVGPMTTSVADAALLMAALSGPDPADPATRGVPGCDPAACRPADLRRTLIAVLREEDFPVAAAPAVMAAYRATIAKLADAGATMIHLALPFDLADLTRRCGQIVTAEAHAIHRAHIGDPALAFGPEVRARVLSGAQISASDYVTNCRSRQEAMAVYDRLMRPFDALLLPTAAISAIPLDAVDEAQVTLAYFTRPANYLGTCAVALPAGLDGDGLPVSVQLMGRAGLDAALLSVAAAVEQAAGSGPCRPPL